MEDWWRHGDHGFSSYGRDIVERIWYDLEPTILANRSDWEDVLRHDAQELHKKYIERMRDFHGYLSTFELEKHAPVKFFKWVMEQRLAKENPRE